MDLDNDDVVPDVTNMTMYQMRLKFENGSIMSPSDIFQQVQKLVKDNIKEIRPKTGRLGDLFVGHGGNGASLFFSFGFYFRKAVEKLEQTHGACSIQYDTDTITESQMKTYLVKYFKKQAEKLSEMAETILKEGLPKEFMDLDD